MRFDYYQSTVPESVGSGEVIHLLSEAGHELKPMHHGAMGYKQGFELGQGGTAFGRLYVGGQKGTTHLVASGEHTGLLVAFLRGRLPDDHLVTRADAAQDYNEPGAYERLRDALRPIAQKHRLAFLQYADEIHPTSGRTQYVGSAQSACRVRAYEKGKQQAAIMRASMPGLNGPMEFLNEETGELVHSDNWSRAEAQVRPPEEWSRRWMAKATPEQVWSCSPWLVESASVLFDVRLDRFIMTRRKQTTDERAFEMMCSQYRKAIRQAIDRCGSVEDLGAHMLQVIDGVESRERLGIV